VRDSERGKPLEEREKREDDEIDQAQHHGDPEQEYLPVQDIGESGATMAKQDHPLLPVFGRHDEIVGTRRPPDIEWEARYHDEAMVYREYQYDNGAQRKQRQQVYLDKWRELGCGKS
jgi:hypothetical protein